MSEPNNISEMKNKIREEVRAEIELELKRTHEAELFLAKEENFYLKNRMVGHSPRRQPGECRQHQLQRLLSDCSTVQNFNEKINFMKNELKAEIYNTPKYGPIKFALPDESASWPSSLEACYLYNSIPDYLTSSACKHPFSHNTTTNSIKKLVHFCSICIAVTGAGKHHKCIECSLIKFLDDFDACPNLGPPMGAPPSLLRKMGPPPRAPPSLLDLNLSMPPPTLSTRPIAAQPSTTIHVIAASRPSEGAQGSALGTPAKTPQVAPHTPTLLCGYKNCDFTSKYHSNLSRHRKRCKHFTTNEDKKSASGVTNIPPDDPAMCSGSSGGTRAAPPPMSRSAAPAVTPPRGVAAPAPSENIAPATTTSAQPQGATPKDASSLKKEIKIKLKDYRKHKSNDKDHASSGKKAPGPHPSTTRSSEQRPIAYCRPVTANSLPLEGSRGSGQAIPAHTPSVAPRPPASGATNQAAPPLVGGAAAPAASPLTDVVALAPSEGTVQAVASRPPSPIPGPSNPLGGEQMGSGGGPAAAAATVRIRNRNKKRPAHLRDTYILNPPKKEKREKKRESDRPAHLRLTRPPKKDTRTEFNELLDSLLIEIDSD